MQAPPINPGSGAGDSPEPEQRQGSQTGGMQDAENTSSGRTLSYIHPSQCQIEKNPADTVRGLGSNPYS